MEWFYDVAKLKKLLIRLDSRSSSNCSIVVLFFKTNAYIVLNELVRYLKLSSVALCAILISENSSRALVREIVALAFQLVPASRRIKAMLDAIFLATTLNGIL